MKTRIFDDPTITRNGMSAEGRTLAIWSLVLWAGVITAGRFLAYTCNYLVYGVPC